MLKANFDATIETGIAKTSWVTWERTLYLEEFTIHQSRISKPSFSGSSQASNKYQSNLDLHSTLSSTGKCYLYVVLYLFIHSSALSKPLSMEDIEVS